MLLTNEKYENVYWTLDFVASAAYYICVIPLEHLDYIAGDYLTYQTFTATL